MWFFTIVLGRVRYKNMKMNYFSLFIFWWTIFGIHNQWLSLFSQSLKLGVVMKIIQILSKRDFINTDLLLFNFVSATAISSKTFYHTWLRTNPFFFYLMWNLFFTHVRTLITSRLVNELNSDQIHKNPNPIQLQTNPNSIQICNW